jgi:hypothetical protein
VRIPLGDEAFGEGDVDGDGGLARRIKIKDGSLHADCAPQAAFERDFAEMFDKRRQIGRAGKGKPGHGFAIGARDGSEGAPFVNSEVSFGPLFCA